ncbi:hypothetical protein GOP47_0008713 [Adiantum capillus-veneris]|uniref:PRLI-interacting factor A n=1 Tax=Adiantum capillus-veneris TaxID=13818 RepID=A0A9D4UZ39_ADICA|nr:hypothetical protein GOP47_0008713 [Adiantum capillus-veneris]
MYSVCLSIPSPTIFFLLRASFLRQLGTESRHRRACARARSHFFLLLLALNHGSASTLLFTVFHQAFVTAVAFLLGKMGHWVTAMAEMGRGNFTVARAPGVKHKMRPKWRRRGGSRFQESQSQGAPLRGGNFFVHRYRGNHPPEAPRNTTSYIIRSKSMGDAIAPVVTPSPFTPAVLPTPGPLPRYKDQCTEEAEEWGVDGYGSMNGLIRMKATNIEKGALIAADEEEDEVEEEVGDEKNDGHYAQSLQQLEQRLDQGLNRFEMVYPCRLDAQQAPPLQDLLIDQEYHIAQLEEENLTLRERLDLIERELGDLRSRIHVLEGGSDHHDSGEVVSEKSVGTSFL